MMKRIACLAITLVCLLMLSGTAAAQNGVLEDTEIEQIAQSVVLIGNIQNGDFVSGGSGTIVDSTGVIFTNRHVIEDADDLAIFMLEDINQRPELRYFATPIEVSRDLDFAVLQIDRDEDGDNIDPDDLTLPAITNFGTDVSRGDDIYAFGYPAIGDALLVVTRGSITTIESGRVSGEQVHIRYQTDAIIAPGNSGGLMVNGDGQFIGIPTLVTSDETTGTQLGGVIPIQAVLASFDLSAVSGQTTQRDEPEQTTQGDQALSIAITRIEHNVSLEGQSGLGMQIYTEIEAVGYEDQDLRAAVFFYFEDGTPISGENAVEDNQTPDGSLTLQDVLTPDSDEWTTEYWFWVPYDSFPGGLSGDVDAFVNAEIGLDGENFTAFSSNEAFVLNYEGGETTRQEESDPPRQQAAAGGVQVECSNADLGFDNGVEIVVLDMPEDATYTATVVGIDGFDPVLAYLDEDGDAVCSDDSEDAAEYAADLPTAENVNEAEVSSQLEFSQESGRSRANVSLIVGGYNNMEGEFIVIVEGADISRDDDPGDPFAVRVTPGMVEAGVPLTIYMLAENNDLDPYLYLYDNDEDVVEDNRGDDIYCDDAGSERCWGQSDELNRSAVSGSGSAIRPGNLDAMLTIPLQDFEVDADDESYLFFMMTSYEQQSFDDYVLVFHLGTS
ncbi:MAG: serine protease [bacterium]|nr:serine protease [bacterium]